MAADESRVHYFTEEIRVVQKKFLSAPTIAVVGASKDQTKVGTRILKWYQARDIKAIPIHPKEHELEGVKALRAISELPSPGETSVHIITPPKVTLAVLKEAKEKDLNIPAFWIQPGASDEAVDSYIKENNLLDRVIYDGPCILPQGDDIRRELREAAESVPASL